MAYKNILVLIDDSKANGGRVKAAVSLAKAEQGYLTGLYVVAERDLPGFVKAQLPPGVLEERKAEKQRAAKSACEDFMGELERAGLQGETRVLRARELDLSAAIIRQARVADLLIVGQSGPDETGISSQGLIEDLVLSVGRPVMVIPFIGAKETIGKVVTLAWDGGREAARAAADAMGILEKAREVHVLAVNPRGDRDRFGDEPGADIALSLARHGVQVEIHATSAPDIGVGEEILSRVADNGSDLLVMGAYGHARLRELVLGGATRLVLESMTVPVLMAH